ncbi:MAG: hypothetical protein AB1512_02790 [Thermodesulfobacteriota bacterium]
MLDFLHHTAMLNVQIKVSEVTVAILLGIASGVIGKYFYDYAVMYFKAKNKKDVTWDWKGFFITIGLSAVIGFLFYGFIFEKVSKLNDFWLIFSASGQAGFFSQSLIGELGKKHA